MGDEYYERLEKRKAAALEILKPLGFVDNEDDECPGTIFHPGISQAFDISATDPKEIVRLVFARGKEVGTTDTQCAVRKALGIAVNS